MDKAKQKKESSDRIAEKLVAFAEQLGEFVATVEAKAEGWLDREMLNQKVGRIRDSADALLALLADMDRENTVRNTPARPSRGPVDAPGKRHRKPLPQERIDKRMGEPRGKQMGQKNFQSGRRSGRG